MPSKGVKKSSMVAQIAPIARQLGVSPSELLQALGAITTGQSSPILDKLPPEFAQKIKSGLLSTPPQPKHQNLEEKGAHRNPADSEFRPGDLVMLHGLAKAQHLNGRKGEVLTVPKKDSTSEGRYVVEIMFMGAIKGGRFVNERKSFRVKSINLKKYQPSAGPSVPINLKYGGRIPMEDIEKAIQAKMYYIELVEGKQVEKEQEKGDNGDDKDPATKRAESKVREEETYENKKNKNGSNDHCQQSGKETRKNEKKMMAEEKRTFACVVEYPKQEYLRSLTKDGATTYIEDLSNIAAKKGPEFLMRSVLRDLPACAFLASIPQEKYHWLYRNLPIISGKVSLRQPKQPISSSGRKEGKNLPQKQTREEIQKQLKKNNHYHIVVINGEEEEEAEEKDSKEKVQLPSFSFFSELFELRRWKGKEKYHQVASPTGGNALMMTRMQNLEKCQEKLLNREKGLSLRYEDAKHAFQQACSFSAASPLSLWLRNSRYYQVLTKEFVRDLAAYLKKRKANYDAAAASAGDVSAGPIVEVGAGLGTLARALRNNGVDLEATTLSTGVFDETRDGIPHGVALEPQLQTIKRLKPSIVLCAWMPYREDWTKRWREEATSVSEYIIIGPRLNPFNVSSGTEATWCVKEQYPGSFLHTEDCPDGWEAHGLPQLFQWLLSADDEDSIPFSTSSILSVRRKKKD